jgi:hypothetical protein
VKPKSQATSNTAKIIINMYVLLGAERSANPDAIDLPLIM